MAPAKPAVVPSIFIGCMEADGSGMEGTDATMVRQSLRKASSARAGAHTPQRANNCIQDFSDSPRTAKRASGEPTRTDDVRRRRASLPSAATPEQTRRTGEAAQGSKSDPVRRVAARGHSQPPPPSAPAGAGELNSSTPSGEEAEHETRQSGNLRDTFPRGSTQLRMG